MLMKLGCQSGPTSEQRLQFFARRHPSWDERFMLYPVFRLESAIGD